MDHYCVFGNPIAHSKSPWIHTEFARLTQQTLCYEATLAPLENFSSTVHAFFSNGGKGCNVTVPFKEEAWRLASKRSPHAEKAGAVNTLWQDAAGLLHGDNTDGVGLVRDITKNAGFSLQNKRILIVGAGGAVRGVISPILAENPAQLVITNRTLSKAQTLVEIFSDEGALSVSAINDLGTQSFDVLINGTSASLQGDALRLDPHLLAPGALAFDMMYGPSLTPFLAWAKTAGAETRDGLGMLVEQAAEAFHIWRNIRPDTATVLAELRQKISA